MQTRNKNARNCSRSAKNLQTRNTHPFYVAGQDHSALLPSRPESPPRLPPRFSGQGLISWWGPCPLEVPGWPKCGQGVAPEIRPCPSECGLCTSSLFHYLSNLISSIDLEQKTPNTLKDLAFSKGPRAKTAKNDAGRRSKGYRLQGGAVGGQRCRSKQDRQLRRRRLRGATSLKGSPRRRP